MQPARPTEHEIVAQAAIRRAAFMRQEVQSGRVPASLPLGQAYLEQADRLELLYADEAVREAARAAEVARLNALYYD